MLTSPGEGDIAPPAQALLHTVRHLKIVVVARNTVIERKPPFPSLMHLTNRTNSFELSSVEDHSPESLIERSGRLRRGHVP